MKIFHVVTKQISRLFFVFFSIYLPYFMKDLSKQFLVFAGKQL